MLVSSTRVEPRANMLDRAARWFGADEEWTRPRPRIGRADLGTAAGFAGFGLLALELARSVGVLDEVGFPPWVQWLATLSGASLLVGRRRWPLTVAAVAAAHMVVVGVTMPLILAQVTLQVAYFVAVMSAVSWASDRRWMVAVVGIIVLVMFVWLVLFFAVGTAVQEFVDRAGAESARPGLIAPLPAAVMLTFLGNIIYFGGAIVAGRISWRNSRQTALLTAQAATITEQGDLLRARAVAEERLRIARELHDVVAHHVSVIGIQAAAARRVMARDPAAAGAALGAIEGSSREAVDSMRGLLGTLRDVRGTDGSEPDSRAPQPGLADLPRLVAGSRTPTRRVSLDVVESPTGCSARCSGPVAQSIYRTVQEALTNVERHSNAAAVSVVVRLEERPHGFVEVEVVDDGRPRAGTSGSGLGQLGIRERAASHRGEVEIGPRAGGGYRVRVRYPWLSAERMAARREPDHVGPSAVSG
jgi:signal transduction histidine kinase